MWYAVKGRLGLFGIIFLGLVSIISVALKGWEVTSGGSSSGALPRCTVKGLRLGFLMLSGLTTMLTIGVLDGSDMMDRLTVGLRRWLAASMPATGFIVDNIV